jgi:hypothetical protein
MAHRVIDYHRPENGSFGDGNSFTRMSQIGPDSADRTERRGCLGHRLFASTLGIATGVLLAWLVFSVHLTTPENYLGLLPTLASVLVLIAVAALRLRNIETPLWKLIFSLIVGLVSMLIVSSVLTQIIGCRYGACIASKHRV